MNLPSYSLFGSTLRPECVATVAVSVGEGAKLCILFDVILTSSGLLAVLDDSAEHFSRLLDLHVEFRCTFWQAYKRVSTFCTAGGGFPQHGRFGVDFLD